MRQPVFFAHLSTSPIIQAYHKTRGLLAILILASVILLAQMVLSPAWAARLTDASFNPATQTLTLQLAEGTFDPEFSVESLNTQVSVGKPGEAMKRTQNPGYRTTIAGNKVQVDEALWSRLATMLYRIKQQPGVEDATLDNVDGRLVLRIESRQPVRPLVLQHKGQQIVIALRNIPTKAPEPDESVTTPPKPTAKPEPIATLAPASKPATKPSTRPTPSFTLPKILPQQNAPEKLASKPQEIPAPAAESKPLPATITEPIAALKSIASTVTQAVENLMPTTPPISDASKSTAPVTPESKPATPEQLSPVMTSGMNTMLSYSPTPLYAQELDPDTMAGVMVPHLSDAWKDYRAGNPQKARQELDDYRAIHPEDGAGHALALMMANADDNPLQTALASQQLFEHQLQSMTDPKKSGNFDAGMLLVRTFIASQQLPAARQILAGLSNKAPRSPEVNYLQGVMAEAEGQLPTARAQYLKALSLNSEHFLAHYRLAMVSLKQNKLDEAAWELGEVLQRRPDDTEALRALGVIAQKQGRIDKAGEYYRRALKPDLLANYAMVLRQQGQKDRALAVAKAAQVIAPNNPDVQYSVGMLMWDLGDTRSGRQLLNAFVNQANVDAERVAMAKSRLGTTLNTPR